MPFSLPQGICRLVYEVAKLVIGQVGKERAEHFRTVVTVYCGCRVEVSRPFRVKVD